jgi:hypothetical protein
VSDIYTIPKALTAIPDGSLKSAAVPIPSTLPLIIPVESPPAIVTTTGPSGSGGVEDAEDKVMEGEGAGENEEEMVLNEENKAEGVFDVAVKLGLGAIEGGKAEVGESESEVDVVKDAWGVRGEEGEDAVDTEKGIEGDGDKEEEKVRETL